VEEHDAENDAEERIHEVSEAAIDDRFIEDSPNENEPIDTD